MQLKLIRLQHIVHAIAGVRDDITTLPTSNAHSVAELLILDLYFTKNFYQVILKRTRLVLYGSKRKIIQRNHLYTVSTKYSNAIQ